MSVKFSAGWDAVTASMEKRQRLLSMTNKSVNVGVLGSEESDMAVIAATLEYGSIKKNIPARPFLRNSLSSRRLLSGVRSISARYLQGKIELPRALDQLGILGVAIVQQSIGSDIQPPNSAATIKAKGSSATLIDTGRLRQSISYEIVEGAGTAVSTATRKPSRGSRRLSKASKRIARLSKQVAARISRGSKKVSKKASRKTKIATKKATSLAQKNGKSVSRAIKKVSRATKKAERKTQKSARKSTRKQR